MASKSGQKFAVCSTVRHLTAIGLATGWTLHLWAKLAKLRRKDEKGEVESLEKYEKSHLDFLLTPKPNFCSSILTTWYNLPIFQDLTSKPDCIVFRVLILRWGLAFCMPSMVPLTLCFSHGLTKAGTLQTIRTFYPFISFLFFSQCSIDSVDSVHWVSTALHQLQPIPYSAQPWRTCTLLRFDFQVNIFKSTPVNFLSFTST